MATSDSTPIGNTVSECELAVATLESELGPVTAKWETLGRKLGIQEWRLEIVAADHPTGDDGASARRLNAVLREWRKNVPDGLWSNIICALREMEENALARGLEEKYCKTTQVFSQTLSCEIQQEQSEEAVAVVDINKQMMKDRFARLLTVIYQKIQERLNAEEIKISDFRVYMTTLFPPGKCIPETLEVSKIFAAITHNCLWDYLNYEPLMRVANMYGGEGPDLEAKLKAYKQDLVGYKLVTKMVDYMSVVPITSSSTSESDDEDESSPLVRKDRKFRRELIVKLKIPISTQSLSYVDEVWATLAEVFLLPSSSAILDKIAEGSLYITWLIPAFFVIQMMEIAEHSDIAHFFQDMKAETVIIDGVCLYEDNEQQNISISLLDENQEPPQKPMGLAIAADSFQDKTTADQHCDTHFSSISVHEEGKRLDEKNLSIIQVKEIDITINGKEVTLLEQGDSFDSSLDDSQEPVTKSKELATAVQEESISDLSTEHDTQEQGDSFDGSLDDSQEPVTKSEELATAVDSFQEESISDLSTEHDTQEQGDSFDGSLDDSQEPVTKSEELATAVDSFQEESISDLSTEHDTQVYEEGENETLSSEQDELATAATSSQEEEIDITRNRELQETSLEEAEAITVKSANDKPSQHPHSHPELQQLPTQPRITGYDVELVWKSEARDLYCPICLLVLRNPMQVQCCGKRFCHLCIEPLIAEEKPCPACKHQHIKMFEDKAQRQAIMAVRIFCPNKSRKCSWDGELCQQENHLNLDPQREKLDDGCKYAIIKCFYCFKEYQRCDMGCHMRSCPQQPHTCPYCKHYTSTFEDVTRKHLPVCEKLPVKCKVCCSTDMSQLIVQCHHLNENISQSIELSIIEPSYQVPPTFIMTSYHYHKNTRKLWFSPPFHSHIGGYKMCLSVDTHSYGSEDPPSMSVFVHLMRGEYDEELTWPFRGDVTVHLLNQRKDDGHITVTISFDDSTADDCADQVIDDEKAPRGWGAYNCIPLSALHYNAYWNTEYLGSARDCLQFQVIQVKPCIKAHDQQSRDSTSTEQPELSSVLPVNVVMNNFISYKIRRYTWYSPPFYSHDRGYKMCLRVDADGGGESEGALLVYVCLMHGVNDDSLKWPFRGTVTIQLLNQERNEGHLVKTIIFNDNTPDMYAGRVAKGEKSLGWGFIEFISHFALLHCDKGTMYLKNDCLKFQVKLNRNAEESPAKSESSTCIKQLELPLIPPELPLIPPITFSMSNFTSYRIQSISWYSSPFYSHVGGYKMCLCVDVSDTHLKVCVCLMRGECDDKLPWPFRGNITIQLVNQMKKETIRFDDNTPSECTAQVTEDERALGNGCSFPLSVLDCFYDSEYLQHDRVYFQITQVKLTKSSWLKFFRRS